MEKQNRPLVTVVIPAYRCEKTIGQAIDSALNQGVPVEVLVIDDQSPDGLQTVLASYQEDDRVRCLVNEENSGVAFSRNRGVREARGEYVAFLDSDDWWEPNKLKHQLQVMKKTGVVLSCTGRELVDPEGISIGRVIPVETKITYRTLLKQNCINCSSVLMKTQVAQEFPMEFDEAHEDYIMWLRILKKYGTAAGINQPYLKYRVAPGSKSGNKWKSAAMTYRVYRYMGYNHLLSACFFISYAFHGVWKYYVRK